MIDLHCDTIHRLLNKDNKDSLLKNSFHVDISKMLIGQSKLQVFAMFVDSATFPDTWERVLNLKARFDEEMALCKDYIVQVRFPEPNEPRIQAILSVEEGAVIGKDLSKLDTLYSMGVRIITLTWNHDNEIGNCHLSENKTGLKPFGFEVLEQMAQRKIVADVSHLNDPGFEDVFSFSKAKNIPFMASHSNSRTLRNVTRNLTDEQIKKVAECGGVIGLNLCPYFVSDESICTFEALARHAEHLYSVGGEDVLALGTDFDGIVGENEVEDMSFMPKLKEVIAKKLGERITEKMWDQNALRVLS